MRRPTSSWGPHTHTHTKPMTTDGSGGGGGGGGSPGAEGEVTVEAIHRFIEGVFTKGRFSPECNIIALVYINRVISTTALPLHKGNWKCVRASVRAYLPACVLLHPSVRPSVRPSVDGSNQANKSVYGPKLTVPRSTPPHHHPQGPRPRGPPPRAEGVERQGRAPLRRGLPPPAARLGGRAHPDVRAALPRAPAVPRHRHARAVSQVVQSCGVGFDSIRFATIRLAGQSELPPLAFPCRVMPSGLG